MMTNVFIAMTITFATTALVSVGGIAAMVPEIHRQAVDIYGWITDSQFATAFAISQIAPGPNILFVSLIGWRVAGFAGLMVATLATIVPTSALAMLAGRTETRLAHAHWYSIVRSCFQPLVVGLITASGIVTAKIAIEDAMGVVLAAGVAVHFAFTRANPLVPIFAAIVVGIVAGRLGYF